MNAQFLSVRGSSAEQFSKLLRRATQNVERVPTHQRRPPCDAPRRKLFLHRRSQSRLQEFQEVEIGIERGDHAADRARGLNEQGEIARDHHVVPPHDIGEFVEELAQNESLHVQSVVFADQHSE